MDAVQERERVLQNIDHERNSQIRKWGEQHHPDGTSENYVAHADHYRKRCDDRFAQGEGTWLDILLEEVFEAAAEQDRSALRRELVQVAAVVVAWAEDIDYRTSFN